MTNAAAARMWWPPEWWAPTRKWTEFRAPEIKSTPTTIARIPRTARTMVSARLLDLPGALAVLTT